MFKIVDFRDIVIACHLTEQEAYQRACKLFEQVGLESTIQDDLGTILHVVSEDFPDKSKDTVDADTDDKTCSKNRMGHDEVTVSKDDGTFKHVLNELPTVNARDGLDNGGTRGELVDSGLDSRPGSHTGDAYNESMTGTGAIATMPAAWTPVKKKTKKKPKTDNPEESVMKYFSEEISNDHGGEKSDMEEMGLGASLGQNDKIKNKGTSQETQGESTSGAASDGITSAINSMGSKLGQNDSITNTGTSQETLGDSTSGSASDGYTSNHKGEMGKTLGANDQMVNTGGQFEQQNSGNMGGSVSEGWDINSLAHQLGGIDYNIQEVFDTYARHNGNICLEGFQMVMSQYASQPIQREMFEALASNNREFLFHEQKDAQGVFYLKENFRPESNQINQSGGSQPGELDSPDYDLGECGTNMRENEPAINHDPNTGRLDAGQNYTNNFDQDATTSSKTSDQSRLHANDHAMGPGMRIIDPNEPQDHNNEPQDHNIPEDGAFPPDSPELEQGQSDYEAGMGMEVNPGAGTEQDAMGMQPGNDFGAPPSGAPMDPMSMGPMGGGEPEVGPDAIISIAGSMDAGEQAGLSPDPMAAMQADPMGAGDPAMDYAGPSAAPTMAAPAMAVPGPGMAGPTMGAQPMGMQQDPNALPLGAVGGDFDFNDPGSLAHQNHQDDDMMLAAGDDGMQDQGRPGNPTEVPGAAVGLGNEYGTDVGRFGSNVDQQAADEEEYITDDFTTMDYAPEDPSQMAGNNYGGQRSMNPHESVLRETHELGMTGTAKANKDGIYTSDATSDNGLRGQGGRDSSGKELGNKVPDQATLESSEGKADDGITDQERSGDLGDNGNVSNDDSSTTMESRMTGDTRKLNENFASLLECAEQAITGFWSNTNLRNQKLVAEFTVVCEGIRTKSRRNLSEAIADIEELIQAYGHNTPELRINYFAENKNLIKKQRVKFGGVPSRRPIVSEGKVIFRYPEVANDFADQVIGENKQCRVYSHNWGAAVGGRFDYNVATRAFKNIPATSGLKKS